MVESGFIPFVLFLLTAFIWALTAFQSRRLYRMFETKYPAVAAKDIPYAFSHVAHPEKAIYFWRRKTRDFLRNDKEIWKVRQRFVHLVFASILVPSTGFTAIFIYALFQIRLTH